MNQKLIWLAGSMALVLAGCGGDSSSGSSDEEAPVESGETQTGVFLDSAVGGIAYKTESLSGVTNAAGEFDYKEGESVTFSIGDLVFPSVAAAGVVTPAEIGEGGGTTTTLNILQLLQSLDADNDPSNGISIAEDAAGAFTGVGAGLVITAASFDNEVAATLTSINRTLKSEADAAAHFADTQNGRLRGSWVYEEGAGMRNVLTFLEGGRYIIFHEHDDGETQKPGSAEHGTYTWDIASGTLTTEVVAESDGQGGLNSGEWIGSLVGGQKFNLAKGDESASFTRVTGSSNAMLGGWQYDETDNLNVLTILSDSSYAIVHTNNTGSYAGEAQQALSGEFGTYSYTGGVFTVTGVTVDTDGDGGLHNKDGDAFALPLEVVPGEALNFGSESSEEQFSFERI